MTPQSITRKIESINPHKKNPFFCIDDPATGNYIQCLRRPSGYVLETRYFFNRDWSKFVHYRGWWPDGHSTRGEARPRTGEWGPWEYERDRVPIDAAIAAFLLFREKPTTLPEVNGLLWRNVTNEFP
ncbi:MAG: hypothetical protein H7A51_08835 [Akkermansiaceae bacterium]|nr:hypothetical protein [Akkermansiaceae bacterium]